ncbi:Apolipoprotein N-acyltransferase [Trichinella spiralis]|uniref:Apolipoprotein N-acyltransferase n=1 Tax=Trichinella spiralis TaxID=6334 RepID=A0ABR3KQA9_TRISP
MPYVAWFFITTCKIIVQFIRVLVIQMLDGLNFLLSGLRYNNMRKWIYMPTVKAWECLLINPDIPLRIFRSLSSSSTIFLVVLDRFIAILKPRLNTKLENHHFIRWCIVASYISCTTFTIVVWLDLTMFKYKEQEVMQSCVYKEVVPKFYQRISRYFNLLLGCLDMIETAHHFANVAAKLSEESILGPFLAL